MSQNVKKAVEWRDTNIYPFSVRYEFPQAVRNRFLFFWVSTKGWRKILNMAAKMVRPNKLCLVYVYGDVKISSIEKYLRKLDKENLVVLLADYITDEQLQIIAEGQDKLKWLKRIGLAVIDEAEPFHSDLAKLSEHLTEDVQIKAVIDKAALINDVIRQTIEQQGYKRLLSGQQVAGAKVEHIEALMDIARAFYPCGVEVDTSGDYAYKLLHFKKLCRLGLDGDVCSAAVIKCGVCYTVANQSYQLSLFDNTSQSVSVFVDFVHSYCDSELANNGYFSLISLLAQLTKPPFGLYYSNYYGLALGLALSKYQFGYYCGDGICTCCKFDFGQLVDMLLSPKSRGYYLVYIYRQTDKQLGFVKRMQQLFGLEPSPYSQLAFDCVESAIHGARKWCGEHIHYDTVQRFSSELFAILNSQKEEKYSNISENWADWLTEEKVVELKQRLAECDNKFLTRLAAKYGRRKCDLYVKGHGYLKQQGRSWLYDVNAVDEEVESYMSKTICRECGAEFRTGRMSYQVLEGDDFGGQIADLYSKDIIALNKKLLNPNGTEFLCLRCLCEFLECSEWDLYEKTVQFKEEGCTLFL